MSLSCQIIIERDLSQFPVTVVRGYSAQGFYDHPTDESRDEIYELTELERKEALKLLYPDDHSQEPEPALCGPAARECADRAEAGWRSERSGR